MRQKGFKGFVTVRELKQRSSWSAIPQSRGVYLVLYPTEERDPGFSINGENGFHVGDPKPSLERLNAEWIEDARVIYIGQTGGKKDGELTNGELRTRIGQYIRYGERGKGGHGGGRYIWSLMKAEELVFCWLKVTDDETDPKEIECTMLREFMKANEGRMPFANLEF